MSTDFAPYRTDVLFLLIGANPIPNYVAARLLASAGGTVHLLHSKSTAVVADRLARKLGQDHPELTLRLFGIPEADGPAIARRVEEIARSHERATPRVTIGLNYTGGTKPMAAYSYHALAQLFPRGVFSYLDARSLSMVIDPGGGTVQKIPVGRSIQPTLKDIADLHGYHITALVREPRHAPIAKAITQTHLAANGMAQWRAWLETWRNGVKLAPLSEYPALAPAFQGFADACGEIPTEVGVAQALGFRDLAQCGKYFAGGWLEDYSLEALTAIAQEAQLGDYAMDLVIQAPRRPDFELDLAATIGYQLFGVSCAATENKGRAKEHLLEVFTRAGQLGGDEARFATISLYEKPETLEAEVSQAWDAVGKIRVFGRAHLRDLSEHLLTWFRDANQEVP